MANICDIDRHAGNFLIEYMPVNCEEIIEYNISDDSGNFINIQIRTPYHVWCIDYGSSRVHSSSSSTTTRDTRTSKKRFKTTNTLWATLTRLDIIPYSKGRL